MLQPMTTPDAAALLRSWMCEWEKMANGLGGDAVRSAEWTRTMHGASGMSLSAQAAGREAMQRLLAATGLPSVAQVKDLSARLAGVEAALGWAPASAAEV